MKISKNQWIIIGVICAVAIWYFFLRKKDTKESGYESNSDSINCTCKDGFVVTGCTSCSTCCDQHRGPTVVRKRRTTFTA